MTAENPGASSPKKNRSGSNKRQRDKITPIRWAEAEFNRVAAKASDAGLAFGAYMRALGLGEPGPRSQRIPPVQNELLIRLQGQLGRLNNNANQIARGINMRDLYDLPELRQALKDYMPIRDAIFVALGKQPSPAARDWDEFAAVAGSALETQPSSESIAIPASLLRRILGNSASPAHSSIHPVSPPPAQQGDKAE